MDLEATVRDLAPRVLRYAHVLTGDRTLAEETAQEALTALVWRWRGRGAPESPEGFVFSIARRPRAPLSMLCARASGAPGT